MAAKSELDRATIFAGIEELIGEGEYPTWTTLRKQLGERGSPAMLQRYMREWYRENGPDLKHKVEARKAARGDRAIGEHLEAATREALAHFNAEQAERVSALDARAGALDQREAELFAREQRLDDREAAQAGWIADLQAQRVSADERRATAEAQHREMAGQLSATRAEQNAVAKALAQAEADLAAARKEHASTRERLASADARMGELDLQVAQLRGHIEGAERMCDSLRADLSRQQSEHREALADLRAERASASQLLRDAKDALHLAQADLAERAAQLAATAQREQSLRDQLLATTSALAHADARIQVEASNVALLQSRMELLQGERDGLASQLETQLAVVDRLSKHLQQAGNAIQK